MLFLILVTILYIGGTVTNGLIGVFAGRISGVLSRNTHVARGLQYATSFIFLGLAAWLAFDRR